MEENQKVLKFKTTTKKFRFRKFLEVLRDRSIKEFSEKEVLRKLEEACEDNGEITLSTNSSCTGYFVWELEANQTKNNQKVLFYFDFENGAIATNYLKATHYFENNTEYFY